jgi:hypothetical protein
MILKNTDFGTAEIIISYKILNELHITKEPTK